MPIVDAQFAVAINAVLQDLAEEVELRYTTATLVNATGAITSMKVLAELLRQAGYEPPELCDQLTSRLARQRN